MTSANAYHVAEFNESDRERWSELWTEYLTFYQTSLPAETYNRSWQRLIEKTGTLRGLCIREKQSKRIMGITHFLFHESTWTDRSICYLQDLYVDRSARGLGLGRRLIEAVAERAREGNCARLYWLTQENNASARMLYDKIASFKGFIRYEYALS